MITKLRFVERIIAENGIGRIVKILQYSDDYNWFDVPLIKLDDTKPDPLAGTPDGLVS